MATETHWLRQAEHDLAAVTDYYQQISPGLVTSLRDDIKRTLQQLQSFPQSAPLVNRKLRRICLTRFPFALYFRFADEKIVVAALLPQRIDPKRVTSTLARRH